MSDPITSMFDAASQTESALFDLQRTQTALSRCYECFSDEWPQAPEGKKLEAWKYKTFTNRAEAYLEMFFVLLENLELHISTLDAATNALYEAIRKTKEEMTP